MKALITTAYGDVDKLTVADVPEPQIGPGDVKVKVHAASINPIDWRLLSGQARTLMELHFPAILGRDVSGDVLEVGGDVKRLRRGDHVLGLASSTFAEHVVAAENAWAKVPTGLDPLAAAALPLVTLTGAQLADAVAPRPGLSILVTGAVGGVGRSAVFVAKAAGAIVWAGVRTQQKEAARLLGADHVVAIDDDLEIAKLPAFDAICDTVSGETIVKLLSRLKPGGVLGSVLGEPPAAKERGVKTIAIRVQPDPNRLAHLAQAAAEKRLVVPVERTFPIEQAAEAFRLARSGVVGKVLLRP
jgi:NADPH:quinone reductase-like Zn-dependent oxidoreductase